MRNTHRVQESQCHICNKVFRTKVLLKKHMMYHDETKRTFKCKLCPDKPGYFTNVALKRHQKSHVGSRESAASWMTIFSSGFPLQILLSIRFYSSIRFALRSAEGTIVCGWRDEMLTKGRRFFAWTKSVNYSFDDDCKLLRFNDPQILPITWYHFCHPFFITDSMVE